MTSLYGNVGGTRKSISSAFANINAAQKQIFPYLAATPLSSLTIGSTVYMKVNGVSTAFIIVHQGRPSTAYDTSCDGTWLLMKDCYTAYVYHNYSYNSYSSTKLRDYLDNTFINLFDSNIINTIKKVRIPFVSGDGLDGNLMTGSRGLSCKVFLLSNPEVNFTEDPFWQDGNCLSYFNSASANANVNSNIRVAYYNGSAVCWWLRSPFNNTASFVYVNEHGSHELRMANSVATTYVRPALIFPSTVLVDDSFNVIAT